MLPLGTALPVFALPDTVTSRSVSHDELLGARACVVTFICNHCPYVKHIMSGLAEFGAWCEAQGVPMVAISSNDQTTHPQDGPAAMAEEARRRGFRFPYLFDESQQVARAFRAACTPEFYVFDSEGRLAYRGQFDDSRPGSPKPVTGTDVRRAVEALLRGDQPAGEQTPSIGCNIKWIRGNAPDYSG
jgi:peroxiredoxin